MAVAGVIGLLMPDLQLRRATESQRAVNLSSFMTRRSRDLQQLVESFYNDLQTSLIGLNLTEALLSEGQQGS